MAEQSTITKNNPTIRLVPMEEFKTQSASSLPFGHNNEVKDDESTVHFEPSIKFRPPPFSLRWFTVLPLLFLSINTAAYTILYLLLETLSQTTRNSVSSSTTSTTLSETFDRNSTTPAAPSINSQAMSSICASRYRENGSGICASSTLASRSSPLSQSSRLTIALFSGALAFLIGITVALLIIDILLHRHILKRRPDLVREKIGEEEKLARLKVGWGLQSSSGSNSKGLSDDEAGSGRIWSIQYLLHKLKTRSSVTRCDRRATLVSVTRWTFSRLFLIVPIWIPLAQYVPRWEFAILQAIIGILVGGILHRRSRWEISWSEMK